MPNTDTAADPPTYAGLTRYLVRSENGEREWHAEDAVHAREQHDDAFAGEPGETLIAVTLAPRATSSK